MKLGIKVGLLGNPKKDLETTFPDFAEIWFNCNKIDKYGDLFSQLNKLHVPSGLHFWGSLPDGTMTNLAYPDREILKNSKLMVKETIDTAAQHKCIYVNLHPSGRILTKVNFEKELFQPFSNKIPTHQALLILTESLSELSEYAQKQGIILLIESTPKRALGQGWHGKDARLKPSDIGEFLVTEIESVLKIPNLYFAHDFGHTAANFITSDRKIIFGNLIDIARHLSIKTRLLHISYIISPYNGTDYHGKLYAPEFNTSDAVPNYPEMLELLTLFVKRNDVYALVEPESDHIGNFKFLKNMVNSVL